MNQIIADDAVDSLRIDWKEPPATGPHVRDSSLLLRTIRDFLSRETWQHFARQILPGVIGHHGRTVEYSGFRFPSDLDPDEEMFEGVELFDPIETIYVSRAAFDRLMRRYFDAIIEHVIAKQLPELYEDWWQDFVASARCLSPSDEA